MTETKIEAMDQAQLWNGPAGDAWTALQPQLDELYAPFEALLVSAVRWHQPARVLDIGCGTGATTLAIARELAGRGSCTGADLSQIMIDRARERAAAEPAGVEARFVRGDASRIDAATPFDMAVSRFGVMFFDDPAAAFARLHGAMSPGAPLAAIAWRAPAENAFMTAAERAAAPLLPPLPPMAPGAPGQFAFADADHVRAILGDSDWQGIELNPVDVECTMPESDLLPYLSHLGRIGIFLRQFDADTRNRVLATVRAAFEPFVDGNTVRFTAACWMIEAKA
ncbi:class I SAM-dependent methyltransferase [Sphingomonas sp. BT-65]|uniref:class I SAM-dependent methyltransferase n=1 Tax=Sphingomonas sp. BT-65 TaxID=2989821 RepID=UPI0022356A0D|nr:class I SAM-dependent methyltransferase [Sphingomonas sp. BT-65]MCW4463760.1 class I SAM-dependent methyltransferase [Sphingomonas sp. BT-65]